MALSEVPQQFKREIWEHIKSTNNGLAETLEILNLLKSGADIDEVVPHDILMLNEILIAFDGEILICNADIPQHIGAKIFD